MAISIIARECMQGICMSILPDDSFKTAHYAPLESSIFSFNTNLRVGDFFINVVDDSVLFKVIGFCWHPVPKEKGLAKNSIASVRCPLLLSMTDIPEDQEVNIKIKQGVFPVAVITLSDKGSRGERVDKSGPAIVEMISSQLKPTFIKTFLIPDDADILRALLTDLALNEKFDLILTTGGTGVTDRDITPQVTLSLIDRPMHGIEQAMMQGSLSITPYAVVSRAVSGLIGKCLVINLPGSLKAAKENLAIVLPAIEHIIKKANGDDADCGG